MKKSAFTLSEINGTSPRPLWVRVRDCKVAFTLSEILITLGVIGVVAAMTLPTLIKEYQKHVWVSQLKKTYSILEQGFQKMLADDEVGKLSDTSVWASLGTDCAHYSGYGAKSFNDAECKDFLSNLNRYFKIISVTAYGEKYYYLNGSISRDGGPNGLENALVLSGGTMVFLHAYATPSNKSAEVCNTIKSLGGNMCSRIVYMYIDINGKKKPNTIGRDIFVFYLSDEGKLYPEYGKDHALFARQTELSSNHYYWKSDSSPEGSSSAARIIENGWKMDY